MKKIILNTLAKEIDINITLEKPKDISFGHYATPIAFSLAKVYKKSPIIIAQELSKKFQKLDIFDKVEPIKGYINFKLSDKILNDFTTKALKDEKNFAKGEYAESILLEYVSANPTGPLHIGHARGAVIGDSLYRVGKHLGYKIKSEYYVNDAGNQIYLLGLSIFLTVQEKILGMEVKWPDQFYKGEYILDLAYEAYKEFDKEIFKDEQNIQKLSIWAKDKMLELIKLDLKRVGIEFESYVSEKELYSKWDQVLKRLKLNGGVYEKESKLWIKSSEFGDEKDRVVVREDGTQTYLAGDIIYHFEKFQSNFDRYINIWGADHHGYISRVKAAIRFLGYDESKLEVILAQMVSLLKGGKPYKMSKRAGNFILMSEVVDEIGADALRFMFLSKKSDTHLEFDVDLLKKQDSSNPIYYIQYAHARINQVFQKSGLTYEDIVDIKLESLEDDAKNLLFFSLLLPEILEDAFKSRALQKLTDYLKSLASHLHKFYNEHKVIGSINEKVYLKIFALTALSLRVGLNLIGIEAKYKM